MFRNSVYSEVTFKTALKWFLLCFLAGNVNAGGFLACHRFVTHITGFATLFGVDFASGHWKDAFAILTVPAYFLGGVVISGYLIDRPAQLGERPHYTTVMGIVAACLLFVALGGFFDLFGAFGSDAVISQDYFLLALLCGASGLQNAAITTSSGATIRTTHLTGITTDLGLGLVRLYYARKNTPQYTRDRRANYLRLGTITAFFLGSVVGAFMLIHFKYLGFLLPTTIALYAMYEARRENPVQQAPSS